MNEIITYDKISLLRLAFKGLDDGELQEMADLMEICVYPSGTILCHEGAYEDVFYIIADGNVSISKRMGADQADRVLRISGRGDMVGEMAMIQHAPRAATVRTVNECTVLQMEKQEFEAILSRNPHMAMDIIRITLDRIRSNDQAMIAELQKTNAVLRQLDRNKLEFIQVAAHELRTPLTVLLGYIKILRTIMDTVNNSMLGTVVEGIISGTNRLHEIVNMMLDVTRIDNETMKIAHAQTPLKSFINDLLVEFKPAISARQLTVVAQHAEEALIVNADPSLIHKALTQLLINAIKYTPDGGRIVITTRPVALDEDTPGAEIAIRDTGIGLDMEHHDLIFEKFYQVGQVALHSSGKTSFKGGGPGLGLAIVRGVVRAHGGKAWVESAGHDEVNYTGSTFYMQLPINPPVPAKKTGSAV